MTIYVNYVNSYARLVWSLMLVSVASLNFLGHHVNNNGISIPRERADAINTIPQAQ